MPEKSHSFAMLSDTGRVRRKNEDACAADGTHGIFVVCDGVGGAAGGEIASRLAASTFIEHMVTAKKMKVSPAVGIHNAVEDANHAVHRHSLKTPALRGMATTLVALCFDSPAPPKNAAGTVWLANVGDSRCYRLRGGILEQLTVDHSVVEEQVRSGEMTREQAELSPIRNVITRAIGSDIEVESDVALLDTEHGDLYLLTSDGLMRDLSDQQIASTLLGGALAGSGDCLENDFASEAWLRALCAELIRAANERGGGDNITCLLVYVA